MSTYTETKHVRGGNAANVGQYSHKSLDVPAVGLDTEGESTVSYGLISSTRNELVEARGERALTEAEDKQLQRLSVALLAQAVRHKYPHATRLHLRSNEDGENQYDVYGVDTATDTYETQPGEYWADESSPEADVVELVWALDLHDDTWAEGVGHLTTGRGEKRVMVDLDNAEKVARSAQAEIEEDAKYSVRGPIRAEKALDAYDDDNSEQDLRMADLLTDLQHYAAAKGLDWDEISSRAAKYYEDELGLQA